VREQHAMVAANRAQLRYIVRRESGRRVPGVGGSELRLSNPLYLLRESSSSRLNEWVNGAVGGGVSASSGDRSRVEGV
jgi:hypothetical protein